MAALGHALAARGYVAPGVGAFGAVASRGHSGLARGGAVPGGAAAAAAVTSCGGHVRARSSVHSGADAGMVKAVAAAGGRASPWASSSRRAFGSSGVAAAGARGRSASGLGGGGGGGGVGGMDGVPVAHHLQAPLGLTPDPPRLDAYLTANIPEISRARIVSSIKEGLVDVNGRLVKKPSHKVSGGDTMVCRIPAPVPMEAAPENIPLEVAYEDEHLMVVNKPAGMVVHPSAGHESGTLVNAVLHHCQLPAMRIVSGKQRDGSGDRNPQLLPDDKVKGAGADTGSGEDVMKEGGEDDSGPNWLENVDGVDGAAAAAGGGGGGGGGGGQPAILRPGIVHRLDKGTSGLIVVAKDGTTHTGLCEQFAARTVRRRYLAIVLGTPDPVSGRVDAPLGRDPRDRLRMGVVHGVGGRPAASNYKVRAALAGGNAALVEWRLETGRTHQIRVHTREIGHPILGDDTYNGGGGMAAEILQRRGIMKMDVARAVVQRCKRPMLHARTLGFRHPITGEELDFAANPPADFEETFNALKGFDI